jgi:hypothetical protein
LESAVYAVAVVEVEGGGRGGCEGYGSAGTLAVHDERWMGLGGVIEGDWKIHQMIGNQS